MAAFMFDDEEIRTSVRSVAYQLRQRPRRLDDGAIGRLAYYFSEVSRLRLF